MVTPEHDTNDGNLNDYSQSISDRSKNNHNNTHHLSNNEASTSNDSNTQQRQFIFECDKATRDEILDILQEFILIAADHVADNGISSFKSPPRR
jgi:hypothetical protein